jgi:predicted GNAT family N-acyltransferase
MSSITKTSASYHFSSAQVSQSEELFKLVNGGYRNEKTRKENVNRYSEVSDVTNLIRDTDKVFWMILQNDNNQIIGSLQISKEQISKEQISKESCKYSLGAFAVDPTYKHLKLGQVMLNEAEKYITAKKADAVFLEVISIAKQSLKATGEWVDSSTEIEAEADTLAEYYKRNGYEFTGSKTIPALKWQQETRKPEFLDKVFFREMKKVLTKPASA